MEKTKKLAVQFIQLAPPMIRTVKAEIQNVGGLKITHPQFRILAAITRGQDTVGAIAIDIGVSQPSMSKMVDSLVRKGFILRSASEKDRRSVSLKLSPKGTSIFNSMRDKAALGLALKIKTLSVAEQATLGAALGQLEPLLKKLQGGKGK